MAGLSTEVRLVGAWIPFCLPVGRGKYKDFDEEFQPARG
jgi:hypothetical protein